MDSRVTCTGIRAEDAYVFKSTMMPLRISFKTSDDKKDDYVVIMKVYVDAYTYIYIYNTYICIYSTIRMNRGCINLYICIIVCVLMCILLTYMTILLIGIYIYAYIFILMLCVCVHI